MDAADLTPDYYHKAKLYFKISLGIFVLMMLFDKIFGKLDVNK